MHLFFPYLLGPWVSFKFSPWVFKKCHFWHLHLPLLVLTELGDIRHRTLIRVRKLPPRVLKKCQL